MFSHTKLASVRPITHLSLAIATRLRAGLLFCLQLLLERGELAP